MLKKEFLQVDGYRQEMRTWVPDDNYQSTGSTFYDALDGGLVMVVGHTEKGMWAYKTYDNFMTVADSWEITDGKSENIIRLKDGRLMSIWQDRSVQNVLGNSLGASDFYAYFSEDDGKTFGNRVAISTESRRLYLMNGRVKRLSTGRIIVPTCLHPNHLLDQKLETAGWVGCFWTDDEGQTWHEGKWVETSKVDQLCEPIAVELPDGSLKMLARTGVGYLYQMDSTDGGETWTEEYPTELRSPCAPFTFTYDPYGERYFVIWDDGFPGPTHQYTRSPIAVAVSKDCKTWKRIFELGNDPMGSYGYPVMHFSPETIEVGFYRSKVRKFGPDNRVTFATFSRNIHPEFASNVNKVRNLTTGEESYVSSRSLVKEGHSTCSEIIEGNDGSLYFFLPSRAGNFRFRTEDNGKTFTCDKVKGDNLNLIRLKDGRLMGLMGRLAVEPRAAALNGSNFWATFSDDEGASFKNPVPITKKDGCYYVQNSRYLRTSSGRILLPVCLHDESELDQKLETAGWVTCFYSDDEGQTWTEGPWVKPEIDQLCECMVAEMREKGHIMMLNRTARGYLYGTDSYDDGATWSPEYPTTLKSPCAPFTFKYDPYSDLYIVLHDNAFPSGQHQYPRSPLTLSVSYDGKTWENLVELGFEHDCSYGYPVVHFTEDELLIGFYRSTTRAFTERNRVHFMKLPRTVHEKLLKK